MTEYEALCRKILEDINAPIPPACNRSLNCQRAGGWPSCQRDAEKVARSLRIGNRRACPRTLF
jgi:hypothetical protein